MPLEINFKEELLNPMENLQKDMSISLLPILCLLAGSLAVLLSVVAGILECSRRKYNVSNEVTHISFSNNLDLNPSNFDFFPTIFLTIFTVLPTLAMSIQQSCQHWLYNCLIFSVFNNLTCHFLFTILTFGSWHH